MEKNAELDEAAAHDAQNAHRLKVGMLPLLFVLNTPPSHCHSTMLVVGLGKSLWHELLSQG